MFLQPISINIFNFLHCMDLSTLPIFCSQCILWSCATKFVWLQCSGFKATRTDNTSWPVQKTETTMDHQLPFWCNLKGTISCPNKLIKPQFVFLPGVTNKSKCFLSNLFFLLAEYLSVCFTNVTQKIYIDQINYLIPTKYFSQVK